MEWSDTSTENPRTDVNIIADINVTANFAIDTFALEYTANPGGTLSGDTSQVVVYGDDGTEVTAVPDTGYHFVEWSDTSTENPRTDVNIIADINVTANFAIDTFALEYTANPGGTLSGDTSQVVVYGDDGTEVTAVPDTGYHFVEWSDTSTENPRTDVNIIADINVTANFAIDTFALEYTANPGGTLSGDTSQVVVYGGNGTAVTVVPDTGYHFVEWSDASTENPRTDVNIIADINVTANFALDPITISGFVTEPDPNYPVADVFIGTGGEPNAVTDSNGFYILLVNTGWSGTIIPSKTDYTFEPNSITYTNVMADSNDNYVGTLDTFIISGYSFDANAISPLADVLVSPDNDGGPFTSRYYGGADVTDANGFYEVLVDTNFSGDVIPSKVGYVFEPNGLTYSNVMNDIAESNDYVGTLLTYIITGYIVNPCELPIQDVLINADNGGGLDTTDPNGYYQVWVDYDWSGTVTPAKDNYTFDPNIMIYTNVLTDQIDHKLSRN